MLQCRKPGFNSWVGKIPWRRKWQPLQYFCLENPMDRGAWQTTVHWVTRVGHDLETKPLPYTHKNIYMHIYIYICLEMRFYFSFILGSFRSRVSINSVQFVSRSCPTLCNPMGCNIPGLPVPHQLQFTQTHAHWVGDAIQPSHSLSSPSPPAFNISQHQGLFKWVSSLHQVAKVLEFQLQHQSLQWIFRIDFL